MPGEAPRTGPSDGWPPRSSRCTTAPTQARAAEDRFDAVFKRNEVPQDVPEYVARRAGDPVHLPALLVAAGLSASTSAARRDIDAGAVRIDGDAVRSRSRTTCARADLVGKVLACGKRKAVRLADPG